MVLVRTDRLRVPFLNFEFNGRCVRHRAFLSVSPER